MFVQFCIMHSYSYLNTAKKIVGVYDGGIPLASWLKQFFKADKKFGSRDRREISHACYCFYRIGGAFKDLNFEERILRALFLCSDSPNKILEELKPEWNENVTLPVDKKLESLSSSKATESIFPFADEVSDEIDRSRFNLSFLVQPDLYLRIRPNKKSTVLQKLEAAGIQFVLLSDDCIQLSNQSKVDQVLLIDEEVVVQDYNSQKVFGSLKDSFFKTSAAVSKLSIWDCCAASGGKSILFHDHFQNVQLTVSDVRESILVNLQNRFKRAGIEKYHSFIADISLAGFSMNKKFDLVICDVPCSGSGTWSRTPEQLHFFKEEKIDHYTSLQKKIAFNASKAMKKGGYFLYITCSVFKEENEEMVEFIQNNLLLKLQSMQYLKGYDKKADTLFTALFTAL